MGALLSFTRNTVTQALPALGPTDADWSTWYRLFNRARFDEEQLAACLLAETLPPDPVGELYVVAANGELIHRSSRQMPGTNLLQAPRIPVSRKCVHRAQRFLHEVWLTPLEDGQRRAIPLRFQRELWQRPSAIAGSGKGFAICELGRGPP